MNQDFEAKSIYESLPMQAALRLYLPHTDDSSASPPIELADKPLPFEHYIAPGKLCEIVHRIFKGKRK